MTQRTPEVRVPITDSDARALLAWYAVSRVPQTARSCLADSGGGSDTAMLLTIGTVIARAPAAYRINGRSLLDAWSEAFQLLQRLRDEQGSIRHLRRKLMAQPASDRDKTRAPLRRCSDELARLDHQIGIVDEHVRCLERDRRVDFDAALSWMAGELERRLQSVNDREAVAWLTRVEGIGA